MGKVSSKTHTQQQLNNYANQHNPNSKEYKANRDNHANQLNKNNDAYNKSRNTNDIASKIERTI